MNRSGSERTPDPPRNRHITAGTAFVCQPAFHPVYWFVLSETTGWSRERNVSYVEGGVTF